MSTTDDDWRERDEQFEAFCASIRKEYGSEADPQDAALREAWQKPGAPGRIRRMLASQPA